jgi:hypothetical protein
VSVGLDTQLHEHREQGRLLADDTPHTAASAHSIVSFAGAMWQAGGV